MGAGAMIQLRPDQAQLKADIYTGWQSGHRNMLAVLPTGGGKSVIVSEVILDGHMQGLTECVIAHRNELVGQMSLHIARRGIKHRIIGSKTTVAQVIQEHRREFNGQSFINPDARCSVASVDTLVARADNLKQWALQVNRWTIDECFPAGTMVVTPTGERPIESVRVGDKILAFNEKTGTFHSRKVMRLFKNPAPRTMIDIDINGRKVLATPGHPFWTDRGWVEAKDLRDGDRCLVEMRPLQHEFSTDQRSPSLSFEEKGQGILQTGMWPCLSNDPREETGEKTGRTYVETVPGLLCDTLASDSYNLFGTMPFENFIRNDGAHQSQIRFRTYEAKQPDAERGSARKNARYLTPHQPSTFGTWWQREASNRSRAKADRNVDRVRFSISDTNTNWMGQITRSDTLQTRYGSSDTQDMCRSGRGIAQHNFETRIRCTERRVFEWQRVDCLAILQSRDIGAIGDGFVYNIEVDDFHTYVANGIVVHNCHHVLKENKWGKAVAMFPNAYGLGVTATPQRADGKGLGMHHEGVFQNMCLGPSMRELIDMGALSDYEIAIPESDFEIDEADLAASGDWSVKKMREASKRSHIVGDVVTEYLKRAAGKRAICFATDVETANEMARKFNEAGVPTAAVSAKTADEIRNDSIRRFRDGRLLCLVNVDLFGEGFDVPAVEVVIMARPTASLAVYLQQFGRALRPLAGKPYGLVIDHVSNWKRHGFPDKPHYWTLDRRDKRARKERDPEEVDLTSCRECSRPYIRALPACPYCGAEPPLPDSASRTPQAVDGDLILLDRAMLEKMRAAIQLEAPGAVADRVGYVAGDLAARGAANKQMERIQAQQRLQAAIEQWAGCQRAIDRSDRESYRRFYLTTGVDVLSALTLKRAEMDELATRVEGWCEKMFPLRA